MLISFFYARVSTAINGANNGQTAVPTRPTAATAIAPNSKNSNIFLHLLFYYVSSNMNIGTNIVLTFAAPGIVHDAKHLVTGAFHRVDACSQRLNTRYYLTRKS